jgi:DNA-binding MarR family transcriptional regulator
VTVPTPATSGPDSELDSVLEEIDPQLYHLVVALEEVSWQIRRIPARAGAKPLTRSQVAALRVLHSQPGLTISQVAEQLGMQVSNLSPLIVVLEAKGLVEKVVDAHDRRIVRLRPTAAATGTRRAIEGRVAQLVSGLPERDRGLLLAAADALHRLAESAHGDK